MNSNNLDIIEGLPKKIILIFCLVLILTNILVQWQISIWKATITLGLLVYPITFLITDYVSEIYGKSVCKKLVLIGLIFATAPSLVLSSLQITAGSLLAYFVAQLHDVWAFHWWKDKTKGRFLWIRNNASTMVSQLLDTLIFTSVAFYGVLDNDTILSIMGSEYPIKILYALADTLPLYIFVGLAVRGQKNSFSRVTSGADKRTVNFTWDDMDRLHRKVAELILRAKFAPDVIIGILRCGIIPAVHLAYILNVDHTGTIFVRTTPSDEILVEKDVEPIVILTTPQDFIGNKKVLLVDTVMASGNSMNLSLEKILKHNPSVVKTAIIVDWPNSPYKLKTGERPQIDFMGTTVTEWPVFPWEH